MSSLQESPLQEKTLEEKNLQEKLIELNRLDLRVRGLRQRLDQGTRRHSIQHRKLQQLSQQLAELETEAKHQQVKANDAESRAKEIDDKIESHRAQMNTITNNKQYQAVLVEVNTLKEEKGKAEESALERMEQLEQLNAKLEEIKASHEAQTKLVEAAEQEVEEAKGEVAETLTEAENEMRAAAIDLPREVIASYSKLSDDNEGEAIGYVQELDRKRREYICSVSNVILPPDVVNALLVRPNDIQYCPSSGVILVMDPKAVQALSGSK